MGQYLFMQSVLYLLLFLITHSVPEAASSPRSTFAAGSMTIPVPPSTPSGRHAVAIDPSGHFGPQWRLQICSDLLRGSAKQISAKSMPVQALRPILKRICTAALKSPQHPAPPSTVRFDVPVPGQPSLFICSR